MKVFKWFSFLCLILLNALPTDAQTNQLKQVDSLLEIATLAYSKTPELAISPALKAYNYALRSKNKLIELKSLRLISTIYWQNGKLNEGEKVAVIGLRVSEEQHIDSLKGNFLELLGLVDYARSKYQRALQRYGSALKIFNQEKNIKKMASLYVNMGVCEKKLAHYEAANKYYFAAAEIQTRLGEKSKLSNTFNSIGNCFMELKWNQKAINYYKKALDLSIATTDSNRMSQSLNNLGYAWIEQKQPDSAIKYLKRSLYLKRNNQNTPGYVLALQNLGSAYTLKHQPHKALSTLLSSIKIAKELEMNEEYLRGCLDISELYIAQKNFSQSIPYILQSEQKAVAIESPELLMKALLLKSQAYENLHQYGEALLAERHAGRLKDSLLNIKQNEAISKLEIQFQTREKNREIRDLSTRSKLDKKLLQQQRLSLNALGITLILLIILLIVAVKSYRTKHADNQRIRNLMYEVHHRVKNNLQMLSGLFTIQLAESEDEGIKTSMRENEARLNSMNLIHQQLYGVNAGTTINIKEYLTQLITHLDITFGGGGKNIRMIADIEEIMIDADKAVPLGLIVNELVTNSFKYAFGPEGGTILVQFKRSKNQAFELIVKDNGKGPAKDAKTAATEGFGLRLVSMMAQQLRAVIETDRSAGFTSIIKF